MTGAQQTRVHPQKCAHAALLAVGAAYMLSMQSRLDGILARPPARCSAGVQGMVNTQHRHQ